MKPIPTLEATVIRMKDEIRRDIKAGVVVPQINSFSELHNYVDANEYGGFCDDSFIDALIAHFGGRNEHEGMPDGMLDYMNAAQDQINEWLSEDGHNKN